MILVHQVSAVWGTTNLLPKIMILKGTQGSSAVTHSAATALPLVGIPRSQWLDVETPSPSLPCSPPPSLPCPTNAHPTPPTLPCSPPHAADPGQASHCIGLSSMYGGVSRAVVGKGGSTSNYWEQGILRVTLKSSLENGC
eukprot:1160623-Pelagomonas_calceolata.AAC.3